MSQTAAGTNAATGPTLTGTYQDSHRVEFTLSGLTFGKAHITFSRNGVVVKEYTLDADGTFLVTFDTASEGTLTTGMTIITDEATSFRVPLPAPPGYTLSGHDRVAIVTGAAGLSGNYYIDWGDDTKPTLAQLGQAPAGHEYMAYGTFTITVWPAKDPYSRTSKDVTIPWNPPKPCMLLKPDFRTDNRTTVRAISDKGGVCVSTEVPGVTPWWNGNRNPGIDDVIDPPIYCRSYAISKPVASFRVEMQYPGEPKPQYVANVAVNGCAGYAYRKLDAQTLWLAPSYSLNAPFTIEWGDGTSDVIPEAVPPGESAEDHAITHQYSGGPGQQYRIKVTTPDPCDTLDCWIEL